MEQKNKQLFSVGDLAKSAGVTVRTLQYYDRNGLLKSTISESGRRVYTRDDILKLQQILFLKSFGFSLEEISSRILSTKSPADLEKVFTQQREIMVEQIKHFNKVVEMLDKIIPETKTDKEISLDKLMTIMNLMKQGNPYSFVIRYFGDRQLKSLADRFSSPDSSKSILSNAEKVFARLDELCKKGADPAGSEGQELAESWWKMVNEFTSGDLDLLKPLISAGMDISNWPEETHKFQNEIKSFLSVALGIYLKKIGISLPEMEK